MVGLIGLGPGCVERPGEQAACGVPKRWESFLIQCHRGAGDLAPENTLPAFELAWQIGTVPEADVRMAKDGTLVAFHDATFERLVKDAPASLRKKGIEDLTWEELGQLDVGSWKGKAFEGQRIPRMADVFKVMQGRSDRRLYLDMKETPLEPLAALASSCGVERQVIAASTDYPLIRRWKELSPRSQTLLWMGGTEAKLSARFKDLQAAEFKGIDQLQIHVHLVDLKAEDPFQPSSEFLRSVAEELRRRHVLFQTLPWNCVDPRVYERLLDLGVESFATDHPKITLQAVRAYYERDRRCR